MRPSSDEGRHPPWERLSEQEVIARTKTDPGAVSFLYRSHYKAIHGYVQRRIGNAHDTNDIVAEVFMSMVRYLPRNRWTGAPFRCWLLVLSKTQINRWIRKRRFTRFWGSIEARDPSTNEREEDSDERIEPMRRALLELPLSIQTVLTLHYFEELSVDAIAAMLGCRPGTVKSRLSRGRELLRQRLIHIQGSNYERRSSRSVLREIEV